jgi:cation diffusion facilitator CzcD-associated flavoprotein CzcO
VRIRNGHRAEARDGGLRNGTPVDAAVVIVGAGFSGVGMAIRLRQTGIEDFVVLEKSGQAGGTWRDNRYPGCACDVHSHLYSFSFELNPDWTRMFATQPEIWAYLERCIDKYGVRAHIRPGCTVTGAEFDEGTDTWRVLVDGAAPVTCRAVVFATGPLHLPAYPDLPGLSSFAGTTFHSATWEHGYDLAGKRVAVIGTGASAIQFVPQIAPQVARLDLYQRTAPWVLPKPDRAIGEREQALYRRLPALQRLRRNAIYWLLESRLPGFTTRRGILRFAQRLARWNIRRSIADPALRARLTPNFAMGCKRVLISNDYYPALARDNVELVTAGIAQVRPDGIVDAGGRFRPVDAIIFGTGFHVTDALDGFHLIGRGGRTLQDAWAEGMEAYLGVAVAGFPNAFLLLGPNSGLGHNSVVFMAEAQMNYVLQALRLLATRRAGSVAVRAGVQRRYNADIQARLAGTVWNTGGCRSWYLDPNGVNRTLWPTYTWRYWLRTRRLDPADFEITAGARRPTAARRG